MLIISKNYRLRLCLNFFFNLLWQAYKNFEISTELSHIWHYLRNAYASDAFAESCPADREVISQYDNKASCKPRIAAGKSQLMGESRTFSIPDDMLDNGNEWIFLSVDHINAKVPCLYKPWNLNLLWDGLDFTCFAIIISDDFLRWFQFCNHDSNRFIYWSVFKSSFLCWWIAYCIGSCLRLKVLFSFISRHNDICTIMAIC